eukprot:scaffold134783_cov28-Tisochrysis_lutea.AAC.1
MLHKAADVAALCIPSSMSQALIMRAEKGCLPVIWYPAVTTPPPSRPPCSPLSACEQRISGRHSHRRGYVRSMAQQILARDNSMQRLAHACGRDMYPCQILHCGEAMFCMKHALYVCKCACVHSVLKGILPCA